MTQVRGIKRELRQVIKDGYGRYAAWVGWCPKCRKWRTHREALGISSYSPTCSKGHYSPGYTAVELLKKLKRMKNA